MNPDLSQLHDIHLPASVSWWPLALGWWLLLALLVVILLVGYGFYRRYQRQRWRREALALLRQLQQQSLTPKMLVVEYSQLLRRVAISRFPRTEVAALTGEQWLVFLDQQMKVPGFQQQGRMLITAPYSATVEGDLDELSALCERWIVGVT